MMRGPLRRRSRADWPSLVVMAGQSREIARIGAARLTVDPVEARFAGMLPQIVFSASVDHIGGVSRAAAAMRRRERQIRSLDDVDDAVGPVLDGLGYEEARREVFPELYLDPVPSLLLGPRVDPMLLGLIARTLARAGADPTDGSAAIHAASALALGGGSSLAREDEEAVSGRPLPADVVVHLERAVHQGAFPVPDEATALLRRWVAAAG
jgi:hypothetical protein